MTVRQWWGQAVLQVRCAKHIGNVSQPRLSAMCRLDPKRDKNKLCNLVKRIRSLYPSGGISTVQSLNLTAFLTWHYRILTDINAEGHKNTNPFARNYHTHHSDSPVGTFCTGSGQVHCHPAVYQHQSFSEGHMTQLQCRRIKDLVCSTFINFSLEFYFTALSHCTPDEMAAARRVLAANSDTQTSSVKPDAYHSWNHVDKFTCWTNIYYSAFADVWSCGKHSDKKSYIYVIYQTTFLFLYIPN